MSQAPTDSTAPMFTDQQMVDIITANLVRALGMIPTEFGNQEEEVRWWAQFRLQAVSLSSRILLPLRYHTTE